MIRFAAVLLFALTLRADQPQIRWEPFPLSNARAGLTAQLGRLTLPLVRSKPAAGTIELAFVRLRAEGSAGRAPVVYLEGGPGGSGISAARSPEALGAFAMLAKNADIILLDTRGVGMSSPRPVCRAERALEPHERFASVTETVGMYTRAARACVEEWKTKGVDVAGFTNRESAADLEDLRLALGVPKLSLLGFSYGTHLALAAIRAHGANIDRAVLIGTEGPNHTRKLPFTLDTQLRKLSLLSDVDMATQLARILEKLEKEPMTVTVTDRARKSDVQVPIGPDALRRILLADIGDGNDFPVFPALLSTIEQGDPSILAWFVEKRYNQISADINLMVLGLECSSSATALREQEIRAQAATSQFGNVMNLLYPEVCAALPAVDLGDEFRGPLVSNVPVLFISGTLDSNTPPWQAEELRWGMPRATHLIVDNAGHEDMLPMAEVQSAIGDHLAGKDVAGRRIARPVPRFKSVEEAKQERKR
ncbi:MAG TPA: alpha/beta fold hydrolase [Thermoanaerobaculia bacterium]|nr:alpha/beta fold hydrolase [Thermoanaerobaculia bacterium]